MTSLHWSTRLKALLVDQPLQRIKVSSSAELPADSPLPNRSAPVAIVVSRYPAAIRRTLERALKEQTPLHAADSYCECVSCVGIAHAKTALTELECPRCEDMSLASLRSSMVTVDGLYTLWSAHKEGFTRWLPQPLPLYISFNFKVKLI